MSHSKLEPETYKRVVRSVCDAIRNQDGNRLIICDGRDWGNTPPAELVGLGVAASTRGYSPTHSRITGQLDECAY